MPSGTGPEAEAKLPTGVSELATMIQSLALPGSRDAAVCGAVPVDVGDAAGAAGVARAGRSGDRPGPERAPTRWGRSPSITTLPVARR